MDYLARVSLSEQVDFRNRVSVAISRQAMQVALEDNAATNHQKRAWLAAFAVSDIAFYTEKFAFNLSANFPDTVTLPDNSVVPLTPDLVTDAMIQASVAQYWDMAATAAVAKNPIPTGTTI